MDVKVYSVWEFVMEGDKMQTHNNIYKSSDTNITSFLFCKSYYLLPLIVLAFFHTVCTAQFYKSEYDKWNLDSLEKFVTEEKKLNDTQLAEIYNVLANKYLNISVEKKKIFAEKAIYFSTKTNNLNYLASAQNVMATYFQDVSMMNEAMNYYLKVLNYATDSKNDKVLALVYFNIANCYYRLNEHNKAIEFYHKYLNLTDIQEIRKGGDWLFSTIGDNFRMMKMYDSAFYYYKKALDPLIVKMPEQYLNIYSAMAQTYYDMNNLSQTDYYVKKAEQYIDKVTNPYYTQLFNSVAGVYYSESGNHTKAFKYLNNNLEIAKSQGNLITMMEGYANLSTYYKNKNDYKKAYQMLSIFQVMNDSLKVKENAIKMTELENKYQSKLKDEQIVNLTKIKNLSTQKEKMFYFITLLLVALIITILIIFLQTKDKLRKEKQLALARDKEEKNKLFIEGLTANLEGQLEERKRISKELHDGIGSTLSAIKLNLEEYLSSNGLKNDAAQSIIHDLGDACDEVRFLAHNTMPPYVTELKLGQIVHLITDKYKLLNNLPHIVLSINESNYTHGLTAFEKANLYRIVQEGIHNAIKHAAAEQINVIINGYDEYLQLIIEDNGKGFDNIDLNHNGIGLKIINERSEAIGACVVMESSKGKGTTLIITLPKE